VKPGNFHQGLLFSGLERLARAIAALHHQAEVDPPSDNGLVYRKICRKPWIFPCIHGAQWIFSLKPIITNPLKVTS